MKSDLHIHTIHSDGTATIDDIINIVNERNPDLIAITDHDSLAGVIEIKEKSNINIISGVEITCTHYHNNKAISVHVLGFGIDLYNNQLNDLLKKNREIRTESLKKAINQLYFDKIIGKNYDQIVKENTNIDGLHITHIYKSLTNEEITYEKVERFKSKLKFDKMEYSSVDDAISAIKQAGGIAVFAHPRRTCRENNSFFNELIEKDFDGIEVFYPNHNQNDILDYLRIIKERNLIMTGGSDWHGDYSPSYWAKIGEFGLTDTETFIKKLERRNKIR